MLTNAPKGTKDVLPNQGYKWNYVERAFADICHKYGFSINFVLARYSRGLRFSCIKFNF